MQITKKRTIVTWLKERDKMPLPSSHNALQHCYFLELNTRCELIFQRDPQNRQQFFIFFAHTH